MSMIQPIFRGITSHIKDSRLMPTTSSMLHIEYQIQFIKNLIVILCFHYAFVKEKGVPIIFIHPNVFF